MYLIQYDDELYEYMSFGDSGIILFQNNEKKYEFNWHEYSKLVDEGRMKIFKK